MNLKSIEFKTPFIGIIQMSSEVSMAVMERCMTRNQRFEKSCEKTYSITYNFKHLNWSEEKFNEKGVREFSPMVPLVVRYLCISLSLSLHFQLHNRCLYHIHRQWLNTVDRTVCRIRYASICCSGNGIAMVFLCTH